MARSICNNNKTWKLLIKDHFHMKYHQTILRACIYIYIYNIFTSTNIRSGWHPSNWSVVPTREIIRPLISKKCLATSGRIPPIGLLKRLLVNMPLEKQVLKNQVYLKWVLKERSGYCRLCRFIVLYIQICQYKWDTNTVILCKPHPNNDADQYYIPAKQWKDKLSKNISI